jgi:hypothetical protein
MTLATYASPKTGAVFTDEATLVKDCDMPSRTIQRHIRGLREQGFITLGQRGNQHQGTEFILPLDVAPETIGEHPPLSVVAPATSEVSSEGSTRHLTHEHPPLMVSAPAIPNIDIDTRTEETDLRFTEQEEEKIASTPEWFEILAQDSRWAPTDGFSEKVERMFPQIDLYAQSVEAYEWLQTTKGKRKPKGLGMFFLNWLKNTAKDSQPSVNGTEPMTQRDKILADKARWEAKG